MRREESSQERRARIEERARKRREKRRGKSNILSSILLIIFGCVFLFSAYKLLDIFLFYNEGKAEYTEIEELAIMVPEVENEEEEPGYEKYYVDFDTLKGLNSDIVGWIRFDQPEVINYPVVHTTDNARYLTKTFQATDNNYGTLFTDMNNSKGFEDTNTIIYGHNMKNGTMFGSLDKYQNEEYYLEHPYFYIYTPDGKASKYQVCAVEIVPADSYRYTISFGSDDEYWDYLNEMLSTDYYNTGAPVDTDSKLVTLSTCTSDDSMRLIVQGVKIEEKDMVKPEE